MPVGSGAGLQETQWYAEVPRSIRWHTLVGIALTLLFFGGFGTWAATAPLASAVIAQGSFVATGSNKIVQHLEGGIIKQILSPRATGRRRSAADPPRQDRGARPQRQLFLRRQRLEIEVAALKAEVSGERSDQAAGDRQGKPSDADVRSMVDEQQKNLACVEAEACDGGEPDPKRHRVAQLSG